MVAQTSMNPGTMEPDGVVPDPKPALVEPQIAPEPTAPEPSPSSKTVSAPVIPSPSSTPAPPPSGIQVLLAKFRVMDGELVLLGPTGARALVALSGIDSEIDLGGLKSHPDDGALGRLLGQITVTEGSVAGVMQALAIESEVHLRNDGALALPNIKAASDGGVIEGSVIGDLRKPGLPFQIRLKGKNIGVAAMAKRATSRVAFSKGGVEGMIEAEGYLVAPNTWRGRGNVEMNGAALARNGLLESLGRYIGVREFVELNFEEATAAFQLKGPVVWFEDIHWKTDNLEFKGLGAVGMNQRAKLGARLYFSQRVREILHRIERQLPERVIREFEQVEGREDFYRDFVISGPLNDLKANFIGSEGRTVEEMLELIRLSAEGEARKEAN